jgi:hypothetical protein
LITQPPLELVQPIGVERRLRARAEMARVVDEQVDVVARRRHQTPTVPVIGHVTGDGVDLGELGELVGCPLEVALGSRVDHEPPVSVRQLLRQREPEPL